MQRIYSEILELLFAGIGTFFDGSGTFNWAEKN